jgi:hypothetical protein
MVKNVSSVADWLIWDTARNTYNTIGDCLYADLGNVETYDSRYHMDMLANGFKVRGVISQTNTSGHRYIYLAIGDAYPYVNAF